MTRNVPLQRRKRADALPLCIFPKGKEAGIRCVSLVTITEAGRDLKVCNYAGCVYNEDPLY